MRLVNKVNLHFYSQPILYIAVADINFVIDQNTLFSFAVQLILNACLLFGKDADFFSVQVHFRYRIGVTLLRCVGFGCVGGCLCVLLGIGAIRFVFICATDHTTEKHHRCKEQAK